MNKKDFDAIVVGSGPNGLSAAITLQRAGLSVLVLEAKSTVGGGLRTEELTLPGFQHDVCSAIHPMAVASPFFQSLPLKDFGLQFIDPPLAAAHPFDDGTAAILSRSMEETTQLLGIDRSTYIRLIVPVMQAWPSIVNDVLSPLRMPKHPLLMAEFGVKAMRSAQALGGIFKEKQARGLWAGMAAHSIQPLSNATTSAIALVLMAVGHMQGWPMPKGGSRSIANYMEIGRASCRERV